MYSIRTTFQQAVRFLKNRFLLVALFFSFSMFSEHKPNYQSTLTCSHCAAAGSPPMIEIDHVGININPILISLRTV